VAERVLAYRRGEGAAARIVVAPRLTAALGAGAPVGARWGDTRIEGVDEMEWRCRLSGAVAAARDGAIEASAAFAELPVAVLAPARAG
jgi:maltooligosyltrehalose synthase